MDNIRIPYNNVLLRAEPDNLEWMGIELDHVPLNTSVFGEVVAVPKFLRYNKKRGSRSERERSIFQRRNRSSLDFRTKMEVRVGDRVIFYHHVKGEVVCDGLMLVPYDKLIAKVGDGLVPINGNVLVEVAEIRTGGRGATVDGIGTVRSVSAHRIDDYMWSDRRDTFDPEAGDSVLFVPKMAYPIESTMHSSFGSLVAIKRKDIILTH